MEFICRFVLNSQAQGASGKNEQSTQTPWRGAQCSCIDLRLGANICNQLCPLCYTCNYSSMLYFA